MLIYLEKKTKKYVLTSRILNKLKNNPILEINNYKNIFDKNIGNFHVQKSIIFAKLNGNAIFDTPPNYGPVKECYFVKTSLNCIFNCSYCYLKGAFKNYFIVIFVNYEDIKKQIKTKIKEIRATGYKDQIYFYLSNYSDTQALNYFSYFNESFIPFFEKFENVTFESRTKSDKINDLLKLKNIPKNFEISYSLNPEEIIEKYEKQTANLNKRIESINKLIKKGFKVGLRFLPILPIDNYEKIYENFLKKIVKNIDLNKINSISIGGLMYPIKDYKKILSKENDLKFLNEIKEEIDGFVKIDSKIRLNIYRIFKKYLKFFHVCMDK